jgi:hypothetical protein
MYSLLTLDVGRRIVSKIAKKREGESVMADTHSYLPHTLCRTPKRQTRTDRAFGGLARYAHPDRLTVVDMQNMSDAAYPALTTRHPRSCCREGDGTFGSAHGMTVFRGKIYHVKKSTLFELIPGGEERELCQVSETQKMFVPFGDRLLILPDKLCYRPDTGEIICMEINTGVIPGARFQYEGAYLPEGMAWVDLGFQNGDAIIAEEMDGDNVIAADTYRIHSLLGRQGVFEGCPKTTRNGSFRFRRHIPDATAWCTLPDGKRLAACEGEYVYLCEENNPFNWYCPSANMPEAGASVLRVAADGDFTACAVWQRQAIFFKENAVCRLTGYDVATFALTERSGVPGVPHTMKNTLYECDGALYYCSHAGVFRYDGVRPEFVSALPHELTDMGRLCGGSDLLHYHLVVREGNYDVWHFVYTPVHDAWHLENSHDMVSMAYYGGFLYMQDGYGYIWASSPMGRSHAGSRPEREIRGQMSARVTFLAEHASDPHGLRLHALALRATSEDSDGEMTVRVQFDHGDGKFIKTIDVATFSGWMHDRLLHIPIPAVRCRGYRILLFMRGCWTIHAVTREIEVGEP